MDLGSSNSTSIGTARYGQQEWWDCNLPEDGRGAGLFDSQEGVYFIMFSFESMSSVWKCCNKPYSRIDMPSMCTSCDSTMIGFNL